MGTTRTLRKTHCFYGHSIAEVGRYPADGSCKECKRERGRIKFEEQRDWLEVYKISRGCSKCGYHGSTGALQFHHLDPSQKTTGFKNSLLCNSKKKMKQEIEKCILLCANCHFEQHASMVYS